MIQEPTTEKRDVIIIGAGASGLMCAIEAGKRHRKVLVIDHAKNPGQKLLMTGGGKCNFTNHHINADDYVSNNPHFCKSALSRYTQWDFLTLLRKHHIAFSERDHGQLFCKGSSRDILNMLLSECKEAGVSFQLNSEIRQITSPECKISLSPGENRFKVSTSRSKTFPNCSRGIAKSRGNAWDLAIPDEPFGGIFDLLSTEQGSYLCQSLVIATGGLSIPATGASPFGYQIAEQFHIKVHPRYAGLVPFTLSPKDKEKLSALSGISVDALVSNKRQSFREKILFTHRGLSGPAILQMSLYWQPGEELTINLLPDIDLFDALKEHQRQHPQRKLKSVLTEYLPKRLVTAMVKSELAENPLQIISHSQFKEISAQIREWRVRPGGTEGYRTAEVTIGGVDCNAISSKTMEAREVAGLFFIGEVLDVSGRLGGYNLQWAWSSGWCAGQNV